MKKIEKNIWNLFFILIALFTLGLASVLYLDFKHISKKLTFELETSVQLVANSISYKLGEEEVLLTSLGKELLLGNKTDLQKQQYLDKVLKKHPLLAGFGLLDKEGNFLVTSSNIDLPQHTSLLKSKSVSHYFKKTLQSENMVVGNTRFFKALNQWIIPIRKAIRDENNEVIGVMTAGILNGEDQNFLDKLQLLSNYNIVIVKDADENGEYFRQYTSGFMEVTEDYLYLHPLNHALVEGIKSRLNAKYSIPFQEIKKQNKVVSFESADVLGNKQLGGLVYNSKYKLWILIKQEYNFLQELVLRSAFIYFGIFIVVFLLLAWLFKRLAHSELDNKKELIFQAEHDELTKLPNRKYMYEYIDEWIDKNSKQFYVLYLDLDNFKNINDKFGHTVGDKILQEVAKRLVSFFSPSDMLVRQGGDEFIVFLTESYTDRLDTLCKALISTISSTYVVDKNEFRIGMCLGISTYPNDSKDINELLSYADTAMYKAKEHKNYYTYFSEDMRHENILKSDIEHELRAAIINEEIYVMYQPQIDRQGKICGVEALARWNNKKLGSVSPEKFIQVAEQTGMMDELGKFIIKKSIQEIKKVQEELNIKFTLSLNISVIQFVEEGFLEDLMNIISEENYNKAFLILEVTESLSISDLDKIVPLLEAINQEGIEISLDDFGTGYSSLSILRKLPINELKIDKSFIDEIVYDINGRKLVQSIIEIGKNFDMKTLAEGVENKEQLEILKDLGCDIIQGYYYSKPLNLVQLMKYLTKGK